MTDDATIVEEEVVATATEHTDAAEEVTPVVAVPEADDATEEEAAA
jgi:hypothetical protein